MQISFFSFLFHGKEDRGARRIKWDTERNEMMGNRFTGEILFGSTRTPESTRVRRVGELVTYIPANRAENKTAKADRVHPVKVLSHFEKKEKEYEIPLPPSSYIFLNVDKLDYWRRSKRLGSKIFLWIEFFFSITVSIVSRAYTEINYAVNRITITSLSVWEKQMLWEYGRILIAAFDVRQVQRKFYSIMRLKDSEEHVHKPIAPQMEIRMEKLIEKRCSSIESSLAFRSSNLFLHDIKLASWKRKGRKDQAQIDRRSNRDTNRWEKENLSGGMHREKRGGIRLQRERKR